LRGEARTLAAQGKFKESIRVYKKIRRRECSPAILVEIGQVCLSAEDTSGALRFAGEALAVEPKCASAVCIIGEVLLRENRRMDAHERFQEARRIDPGSAWANRRLAEFATTSRREQGVSVKPVSIQARETEATNQDEAWVK